MKLSIIFIIFFLVSCESGKNSYYSTDVTGINYGSFEFIDKNFSEVSDISDKPDIYLVSFGFTYCPDFCPNNLIKFSKIIENLNQSKINIKLIFVSIDPERDTVNNVISYVENINDSFIGTVATKENFDQLKNHFKIFVLKNGDSKFYTIDHSTRTYLYDRNKILRLLIPGNLEKDKIEQDLRTIAYTF
jgi:protein SCO1/2